MVSSSARALAVAALGLLAAACSGLSVDHDYDLEADFESLETYAWIEPGSDLGASEIVHRRAVRHVDDVLASKGFRRVEAPVGDEDPSDDAAAGDAATGDDASGDDASGDAPDFLVAVHHDTEQRVRVTDWGYDYGFWSRGYAGFSSRRLDVTEYEEGVLFIDVVAPAQNRLIWRGEARRAVDAGATAAERDARVREAVERLLAPFPPEPRERD